MNTYCDYYGVVDEKGVVPIIFLGNRYFYGLDSIENSFGEYVQSGRYETTPILTAKDNNWDKEQFNGLNLGLVLVAGLVNGINPCSISMLLFFITVIVSSKENIKKYSYSFVFGKFIAFFLLGTVFYKLLGSMDFDLLNKVVKILLIIGTTILVIGNIHDFIVIKQKKYEKIKVQLPSKLIKINHNIMRKIDFKNFRKTTLFLCFIMGSLISCGEFLCSGQVYLSTIVTVLNHEKSYTLAAMLYLLVFDIAFVLPLILCIELVVRKKSVIDVSKFFVNKIHYIKLINAIIFSAFIIFYFMF